MVSFKFRTSKTVNFATDVLSKHGFHLNDSPKNVSQVITGAKKSHAGYIFLDFFKLPKEEKEKYINLIDITTKI
jgi:hypothetical protein